MARSYKRDSKGRFARIAANRSARKRIRAEYKHGKKFNRSIAAYAVQSGRMTESQARARLKVIQAQEKKAYKQELKGLRVKR